MPNASSSVARAVGEHFPWIAGGDLRRISSIDASPYPAPDGAALLLGHDLWIEPLVRFREEVERTGDDPPPLWQFPWMPSRAWNVSAWLELPVEARILRARAGSLTHDVTLRATARGLALPAAEFSHGLDALRGTGAASDTRPVVLRAVSEERGLQTDLSLVELLVHWLRMLTHRERVLRHSEGNAFDVCGYARACARCRSRWGVAPRIAASVPPFHPGCRCFAQPRFTKLTEARRHEG
jgi:hypothetical protein